MRKTIVLNVDDDEAGRFAVTHTLRRAGFEVWEAETGEAALELADRGPDVVLLDINLPDIDGFEVCRRLRENPKTRGITVVQMSASSVAGAHKVQGLDGGADGYLTEPVGAAELVATVRAFARLRRAEAAQRFLAQAAGVLASTLNYDEALDRVAHLAVPFLGDWCLVDKIDGAGNIEQAAIAHADPERERRGRELSRRLGAQNELAHGVAHVLRTGQAEIFPDVDDVHWVAAALGAEHPDVLRELGARSYLCVPLVARGRTLGAISLVADGSGRRFGREELELAQDLAASAAVAIDNARLYGDARAAEARLRVATEAAALGIWDHDPVTNVLRWDDRSKELFGLPPEAPVDYDAFLRGLHPGDRDRVQAAMRSALDPAGDGRYEVEFRTVGLLDGVQRWVAARGQGFFEGGKAVRLTGTLLDVSARMADERERARLLARAEAARAEAERLNRVKDEFLATVSHELRTPLTAILGWTRLLRAGAVPEGRRARALETVERNAIAQTQLIGDILDVSRIVSGKMRLNVVAADVRKVVEAALDVVRPAAEAKGVRLQLALDSSAGPIIGDPDRLQQIVWNLLTNAVKFTPKGGRVRVQLSQKDSSIEIAVEDTGKGISPEFLPHVFDRFRQEEGGTARSQGGLGLGLAIVRHLVELHGGTIAAHSEGENRGATFVVTLPVSPALSTQVSWPNAPTAPGLECPPELDGLRVLVVDDEDDARELLASILEPCGALVTAAASVAEALAAVGRTRFDVVVSDIGMPGEDGYSLLRKIRQLPAAAGGNVPVIALTAFARPEDRTRALTAGFSMHMAKPIDPAELLVVVAHAASLAK